MTSSGRWMGTWLLAGCLMLVSHTAWAQTTTGTVSGRVTDASSSEPLPGASVSVAGTSLSTATDRTGAFRLSGVPAGRQTLIINYLGRTELQDIVTIEPGAVLTTAIALPRTQFTEEVSVRGRTIADGQARALNQQRTAPNIVNIVATDQISRFPDANAAEAAQRVPGVSIERDQGEGRYVVVRGTEPRLNSMMINGERIPSPEGDVRAVALDVIPADLLQAIEVSKALTPDMDADAIGGAVNLVTRAVTNQPIATFSAGGGYNTLMSDAGQGSFSGVVGRRVNDGRTGLLFAISGSNVNRGSDNIEMAYDDGDLEELQVRDYTVNRRRFGINGAVDFRPDDRASYWVNGMWNRFSDQEYRRTAIHLVSDNEMERELKDRLETQTIFSSSFGGKRLTTRGWEMDFNVSASYANEDEPDAFYTVFLQEDVDFAPNVTPTSINPDNIQANPLNEDTDAYELDGFSAERNFTSDRDIVGAYNLRMPLGTTDSRASFLKVGAKFRAKRKMADANTTEYETDDTVPFAGLIDTTFNPGRFLDGRYVPGPHVNPAAGRALRNRSDLETEFDVETDAGDFQANEYVTAGYAMAELFFGGNWFVLPGVRFEATRLNYTGNEVIFDEEGDYVSTVPLDGRDSYAQLLPHLHVRYAINDMSNLRVALTRTLARPNYYDLVPYQLVIEEDREVELGNPALRPTTSWNFDVLGERYLTSVGIVSGGVFYKRLNDYIYNSTFTADRNGDRYEYLQPQNGESAWLAGAELAFQSQLSFLPGPLDGLGIYTNYTFTTSRAQFPGRDTSATLPGQSRHLGNFAVWYEKAGFSARMAMNFHGRFISEVGESAEEDQYYDNHNQLDITVSQAIGPRMRLFAEFLNLTNAPLRYYEGVPTRPIQEEYYRTWMNFGVKFTF